jgi:crotonobetainyl-CoA:carnitine CoA-transferase CaiB-like acyl-CoA transferase
LVAHKPACGRFSDCGCTTEGAKVPNLARILGDPWIGQTLADLKADVVKVESSAGDATRKRGSPFVVGADGAQ